MTKDQAHRILDQLRLGQADYDVRLIRKALKETGDLVDHPAPRPLCSGRDAGWLPGPRVARSNRNGLVGPYFDIACERIEVAQRQGTLLPPEPPRECVQEGLL